MYTRVVTFQFRPGKLAGAVQIHRDLVVPALAAQPGFGGARLLTDPASGKGLMLTFWERRADLAAVEASGLFQEQLAQFQPVLGAPVVRESYEVSATAGAGGAPGGR